MSPAFSFNRLRLLSIAKTGTVLIAMAVMLNGGMARAAVEKAVYRDEVYSLSWMNAGLADAIAEYFTGNGYTVLDTAGLKEFMLQRIADRKASVVIMANDLMPDEVVGTTQSPSNIFNRYLRSGGKVIYLADWPLYYTALADGTRTENADVGAARILDFFPARWGFDGGGDITFTAEGTKWGLTKPWSSQRAADPKDVDIVLGIAATKGGAMPYVKTFTNRQGAGLVYLYDFPTAIDSMDEEDLAQIQRVAEYFPAGDAPLTMGVEGVIKGADGKPVADARVLLTGGPKPLSYFTDAEGKYAFFVDPGAYTVFLESADKTKEILGGSANVTVADGKMTLQDLTTTVVDIRSVELTGENSTWRFFKEGTTPFDPKIIDPAFNDSAWMETGPTARVEPADVEIPDGNFWIRGRFTLPADFASERGARLYGFDVDARSMGIWVNGIPIGSRPAGNSPADHDFLIPSGVLRKGSENVVVVRGDNGGGNMGLGPSSFKVLEVNNLNGTVQVRASGADPGIGGVGGGITVNLLNATGGLVASATTNVQGVAQFLNVPPATYTVSAAGRLVDEGISVPNVNVTAGATTVVSLSSNPAKGLANAWLVQGGPWKVLPEADPSDLAPAQPGFNDSSWQTNVFVPGNLKHAENGLTGFGDNMDAWYRVSFTVPAAFNVDGRNLFLDDFNNDDDDIVFFNGKEIGRGGCCGERNFEIQNQDVKFGEANTLAILVHNGGGDFGITDRARSIRLRVAPGTGAVGMPGDLNDDKKINVQDATLSLRIAVGLLTPTAAQTEAGDVNNDGKLNIQDTTLILQVAVGNKPASELK